MVALGGCVGASAHYRVLQARADADSPAPGAVLLLPVDVRVYRAQERGLHEQDAARSDAASAYVTEALEAGLARRGFLPRRFQAWSADELEAVGAHRRLLRQFSEHSSIRAVEHGTGAPVRIEPELRLGHGLAELAARTGCEWAFLVQGGSVREGGEHGAMSRLSSILDFPIVLATGVGPVSATALTAAWVHLPSGRMRWLATVQAKGGTFAAASSLGERDGARELVAGLLERLAPTAEAQR